jgi:membrane protein
MFKRILSIIRGGFASMGRTIARSWHGLFERRIPMMSAGLAFYFLLGLIPFLFILAASAGYFLKNNPGIQNQLTATVIEFFPQGIGDRLLPHIGSTAEGWQGFGAFGLLGIVVVAMGLFDALDDGINAAMGTRKKVGFLTGRVISLAYVVGAILFFSIAAGASYSLKLFAALPVFQQYPALVEMPGRYFSIWVFAVFLLALYMTFPVRPPKFLHAVVMALIVTFVWSVLQKLGTYITAGITRRQAIYGALAGAAVFLTWMYLLAFLILIGARILDFWRGAADRRSGAKDNGQGHIL